MAPNNPKPHLPVVVEEEHRTPSSPSRTPTPSTRAQLPLRVAEKLHFIADSALKNGIHIVGGPGTGKTTLMSRIIAWQAFMRRKPTMVLDPTGGIVAGIVDKVSRLPVELRRQLWPRLVYVDVGATDYIVPSPLYTRRSTTETLFEAANRFPAVLKRQDPQLQSAPIMGWNSLYECAIYAGQIAVALERQIDFVADLLDCPVQYKMELRQALADFPELEPAVRYFRNLMAPDAGNLRERRTGSFGNKLLPIMADPSMLASFAAPSGRIDWAETVENGQLVLIGFQHEQDPERRQFKLIWWFRSIIDYVKSRGMAGRGREIFFLIDEVTQLLGFRTGEGNSVLAEDLEELVAVLGRNYGVNVVIAHQNLSQVDERIRNILMQLGTQVIGRIDNPDDRYFLARYLFRYDPYWVKKQEPIWMNLQQFDEYGLYEQISLPEIQDYRDVEFTPEEQLLKAMEMFHLPRFQFWMRPALAEGTISQRLYRLSIERMDAGQYPDDAQVADVLKLLRQKCGLPLDTILEEIRARRGVSPDLTQRRVKSRAATAILDANSSHEQHNRSKSARNRAIRPQSPAEDSGAKVKAGHLRPDFWS